MLRITALSAIAGLITLLPVAGLLGRFRRRESPKEQGDEVQPSPSPPPRQPEPTAPSQSVVSAKGAFEKWLETAETWEEDADRTPEYLLRRRPAVFIGLGDAGRRVLEHIADYLAARWGQPWPDRIRLLHVDVGELNREQSEPSMGTSLPTVILYPRLERLKLDQITWYAGDRRRPGQGRDLGKLAVFADLADGKARSKLWPALVNAIGDLNDISVYMVADSFSNAGSGMIADVAHLLRAAAAGQVERVSLFLAGQHAQWRDDLTPMRRAERTFATLRELQRLQRQAPVRFPYAPGLGQSELDAISRGTLFDEIVFCDGLGAEVGPYTHDLSQLPAEDGLLPAMAGCLIALLDPELSKRFYQMWVNEASEPARRGEIPLENFASAMGSHTFRLPVGEMRRILECRLVHQLLFDRQQGWIGWEDLAEDGEVRQRGQVVINPVGPSDVEDFFRTRGLSKEIAQRLAPQDLQRHLTGYLETQLNQGSGTRLRWALGFINELRKKLPDRDAELEEIARALRQWIKAVGEAQTPDEEIDPVASFLGITPEQTWGGKEIEAGPLYHAWKKEWENARELFGRVSRMHAHRLFWDLDDECQLFDRYITSQGALERMRGRTWWRWSSFQGSLQLRLLVLPSALDEPDPGSPHRTRRQSIHRSPEAFTLAVDQPERVISRLLDVATAFSRALDQARLTALLKDEDTNQLAGELVQRSSPLYRAHRVGEHLVAVVPFGYFTGPDGKEVRTLADAVQHQLVAPMQARRTDVPRGTFQFHPLVPSADETSCRLLQVEHMLPLRNMVAYVEARDRYVPRPDLHVFEAEQIATRLEELAERKLARDISRIVFSPYFVELLHRNEDGVRLYGRCVVHGLIEVNPASMRILACQDADLEDLVGLPAHEAAQHFLEISTATPSLSQRLQNLIAASRPSEYGERLDRLDAMRDEMIVPLSRRDDPEAHDLALLLGAIIVEEERSD